MTISADRWQQIVRAFPSLSQSERDAALRIGPAAFTLWGQLVDASNGRASDVPPLGGIDCGRCMTLCRIADGESGPWDE